MSVQVQTKISENEYLAMEREADFRSEYYNGEIFAMAGASRRHNLIVSNTVREISLQMKGRKCNVYSSDMRVKVSPTGLYTYPDIVAVCGKEEYEDREADTLLNPSLIVEVLSKSTESYDRGEKFAHYRNLASLREYILISQNRFHMEQYIRQSGSQWMLSEFSHPDDMVEIPSVECVLKLSEIYDKLEFSEKEVQNIVSSAGKNRQSGASLLNPKGFGIK